MATLHEVKRRHAEYYTVKVREIDETYLAEPMARAAAIATFDRDWDQINAAHVWVTEVARDPWLAFLLFKNGNALLALRRSLPERLRWLQAVEGPIASLGETIEQASLFSERAKLAYESAELAQAAQWYEKALAIVRQIGDRRGEAGFIQSLGNIHVQLREFAAAISCYEQALEMSRALGDLRGEAVGLGSLGIAYADEGNHARAIAFYEQALEILTKLEEPGELETFTGNLGNSHSAVGDHTRAMEHLRAALSIAEELGDLRRQVLRTGNIASAYRAAGDLDQALEYGKRALVLARERGMPEATATSLARLAGIHTAREEIDEALRQYEEAESLYDALGLRAQAQDMKHNTEAVRFGVEFHTHMRVGIEDTNAGRLQDALREFGAGVLMARARKSLSREALALGNIGFAYLNGNELEEAERFLLAALEISTRLSDPSLAAHHLGSLGNVMQLRGDFTNAELYFDSALRLFRTAPSGTIAEQGAISANLGNLARERDEPGRARKYFADALQCFRRAGQGANAQKMEAALNGLDSENRPDANSQ